MRRRGDTCRNDWRDDPLAQPAKGLPRTPLFARHSYIGVIMLWRVKGRPARLKPACFIEPCVASQALKVPTGPGWLYEIKHDGYRMQVRKDGDRVRLLTRRGFDWTERYPLAAAGARKLKAKTCTIDCELVCAAADGVADFASLHSRCADDAAFLYAFDLMELNGKDLKALPLLERKARLAKLINGRGKTGIHLVDHDTGDGAALFQAACKMGLEGIVAKRAASKYYPGPKRCLAWVKVKNKTAPGYLRFRDGMEG
jgi:bifunctional non-homologous end joining protein LigD